MMVIFILSVQKLAKKLDCKLTPKVDDSAISASPVVNSMGNIFRRTNEGYSYSIFNARDIRREKNLESGHISSAVLSEDGLFTC
jgi:hypothetical protein